ncbi:MAG: hypothetical protein KAS04_00635 [Candidatus Aenigmarchaeota archaeon]|nr:hypothetical protein [Candidatus Aenigmarchaeota archaeon]
MAFGKVTPVVEPEKMNFDSFYHYLIDVHEPEKMDVEKLMGRTFEYTEISFAIWYAGVDPTDLNMENAIKHALKKKWISETVSGRKSLYTLNGESLNEYKNSMILEKRRINRQYEKMEKYRQAFIL